MAEKDLAEKKLEAYAEVFADIFNVLLFKKEIIKPEQLLDGPTESVYKAESGSLKGQYRDTLKHYRNSTFSVASFGIENQSKIDADMPIRVLGYDYTSYHEQTVNGVKRFPVITIVLNFSNKKWDKPTSLKELLEMPEELEPFVQDYRIYVFDIAHLEPGIIKQFKSTFKHVAHFFSNKEKEDYQPLNEEIKELDAFLDLLKVFTNDDRYEAIKAGLIEQQQKGQVITMCTVVERFTSKGIEQGIEQGIERCVLNAYQKGKTPKEISEFLDIELEIVNDIVSRQSE